MNPWLFSCLKSALPLGDFTRVYVRQRSGFWWIKVRGDDTIRALRIYEYSAGVFRLTTSKPGHGFCRHDIRADVRERVEGSNLELSFSEAEAATVIPWAVRHLSEPVDAMPIWVAPRWQMNIEIGKPFRAYTWTSKAAAIYESNKKIRARN